MQLVFNPITGNLDVVNEAGVPVSFILDGGNATSVYGGASIDCGSAS
jgi:hypothetical protein